jgi:hypothetical protein
MLEIPFNLNDILIHLMFDRRNEFEFMELFCKTTKITSKFGFNLPKKVIGIK